MNWFIKLFTPASPKTKIGWIVLQHGLVRQVEVENRCPMRYYNSTTITANGYWWCYELNKCVCDGKDFFTSKKDALKAFLEKENRMINSFEIEIITRKNALRTVITQLKEELSPEELKQLESEE